MVVPRNIFSLRDATDCVATRKLSRIRSLRSLCIAPVTGLSPNAIRADRSAISGSVPLSRHDNEAKSNRFDESGGGEVYSFRNLIADHAICNIACDAMANVSMR